MIYLTHAEVKYTEEVELLDSIAYPQKVHWFPDSYARVSSGLTYPAHWVMNNVLKPSVMESVSGKPAKTAFIYAAGNGTLGTNDSKESTSLSYSYRVLPLILTNIFAGRTSQNFGQIDSVQTDASACASSLKVMTDVQTLIKFYGYDRVIVLSGEDPVSNMTLRFFGETKASLLDPDKLPSAFDSVNQGFHVGQGAVLAVFETEKALSTDPIAVLKGAMFAGENSTNAIGQLESGEGFIKAIEGSLNQSGILPSDISVVKTHGTGTISNNTSERNALKQSLSNFVATSYKPLIGHTMGASGLLESIMLIKSLRSGTVPRILNRTEIDSIFLSFDCPSPDDGYLLSLAAGMGNIYASAVFDWRV